MSKTVFVVGHEQEYERMFASNGWELSPFEDADFVQFTGGADVTPALYKERNVHAYNQVNRDLVEIGIFNEARAKGKNLLGICRGGQFLTVMSGHRLWQDVDNHALGGTHTATVLATGEQVEVSSTHHQMFRLRNGVDATVLVAASRSTRKLSGQDEEDIQENSLEDLESVFYKHTRALAFQPHPEFFDKNHECQKLYFRLIDENFN